MNFVCPGSPRRRKAAPKAGTSGVNGVATGEEDGNQTMGRPSRQERALVRAIEAAGSRRTPQAKTPSSLNVSVGSSSAAQRTSSSTRIYAERGTKGYSQAQQWKHKKTKCSLHS